MPRFDLLPHFAAGYAMLLLAAGGLCRGEIHSGEAIYKQRCSGCHELANPRIPHREALQQMSSARIQRSLDFGAMMSVAAPMARAEREAVAVFLGKSGGNEAPPASAMCAQRTVPALAIGGGISWNGWSPSPQNARFQGAKAAGMDGDSLPRLSLLWAFVYDGDVTAFAPPTVINGTIFAGSAGGVVHALDAKTGCIRWMFQAAGPVRSALLAVPVPGGQALLFGDQTGWFYSLNARTGKMLWKRKVEEHDAARLTGSPVFHQGLVFVPVASWEETRASNPAYVCCTFRGSVVALRASDGSVVWKTYTISEIATERGKAKNGTARWGPSGAGIWAAPTLDTERKLLYVTTGDNYSHPATETSDAVMALDADTGRIAWTRQFTKGDVFVAGCGGATPGVHCPEGGNGPDFDFGASAALVRTHEGRQLLLVGQKSGMIYALDPARKGEVVWEARAGQGGVVGGVQWGIAADNTHVYAAVSDAGFQRLQVRGPLDVSMKLDPGKGGGLTAFRLADGVQSWFAPPHACPAEAPRCSPAQSAALTAIPGAVFSGSLDGHLRAFSTEDGKLLWDIDTVREYAGVNGVKGRGGSLDGPGPVVVDGMLFVNSGYSRFGGVPGNVLLAFRLDGSR